jgi:GNAT superfamily N-acetyltransferase
MIEIIKPQTKEELDEVRKLIRAFVAWHRDRHLQDHALIDSYFDEEAFEKELAMLPGAYAPPRGCLLLAYSDQKPAGCVALKEIDKDTCEMKRMFVYSKFHGKGVGVALTARIIEEARRIGYSTIKLDTSIRQREAQELYSKMGFVQTGPYYEMPKALQDWLVFMELKL